ncbi:hypothetical protein [Maledivibacter halophilus]|uniref:Uncharacterized protein n=1 Tax=Maledivibacter halophilus TaxID=36842 RepID=A0A1T5LV47_9FIRM|nr:hypothetical protein [Maledivibacter halophilus]SKC79781.1 hypothetical protein SAMN02194393_03360 [Maledivibacter halophilus]
MNITVDEFNLLENEVLNKVLYFSLRDDYSNEVSRAKNMFKTIIERNSYSYDEKNFTAWLLWDYKLENKNNFFEEYKRINGNKIIKNQYDMLESLINSYLSIYEFEFHKKDEKLIDIFSKKELNIKRSIKEINSNDLLLGRVVEFRGENFVLDDYLILDKAFRNSIEKSFYEKFKNYKEKKGIYEIQEFVKENSLLLYSFADIIDDLAKKQVEDNNEYSVFQSNYAVLNHNFIYEALLENKNIELDYRENNSSYYIMYEEEKKKILGEIVLFKDKLEIECISQIDNDKAKEIIEKLANDSIKHISDEFITIDDLI